MKAIMLALLIILFLPTFSFAAQIYGSLREGNRSVGQGVKVDVVCSDGTHSVVTDGYGSFNHFVKQRGKCTMVVYYGGQTPSAVIYSYDDPVRYDFDLIKQGDGQYVLKRR